MYGTLPNMFKKSGFLIVHKKAKLSDPIEHEEKIQDDEIPNDNLGIVKYKQIALEFVVSSRSKKFFRFLLSNLRKSLRILLKTFPKINKNSKLFRNQNYGIR